MEGKGLSEGCRFAEGGVSKTTKPLTHVKPETKDLDGERGARDSLRVKRKDVMEEVWAGRRRL